MDDAIAKVLDNRIGVLDIFSLYVPREHAIPQCYDALTWKYFVCEYQGNPGFVELNGQLAVL